MKIPVVSNVLEESDALAKKNRATFDVHNLFVVNIMSSPGAGKTTLLVRTIAELKQKGYRCAVIEGDITSTIDSERFSPLEISVVQANTAPFGGDCHVGSHLVHAALQMLPLAELDFIFIENIGNLVCPAEFYLGEHKKVVVLSLPEGEDKPMKYPLMFRECQLCLVSKTDLLPFLDTDIATLRRNLDLVNGDLEVIEISAKVGIGLENWLSWLVNGKSAQHLAISQNKSNAGITSTS
ncbi:MAG: hydrogenase nickel incorporation protein HypB [Calditrichaeota bacterium]|nr:hydrogenase nickel incorporation protein HypB [Calditrichota bacterium]